MGVLAAVGRRGDGAWAGRLADADDNAPDGSRICRDYPFDAKTNPAFERTAICTCGEARLSR
ncbi:hypothetical protein GCM10010331_71470 [Streptomyces xanthochromogenes]|nr:hypothetical protein GCM10010331_71470 [Streptomyces xanthochromogenes]